MMSTLTLRTFQVWCYLLVQLTHAAGFGRAHFLTSCVLLQRSSPTMTRTSCIALEEWSAPVLFKLSTSLSAAVLLMCLTFWSTFDSHCFVFECCIEQLYDFVSQLVTHWSESATSLIPTYE